jgi:hypothetical protein
MGRPPALPYNVEMPEVFMGEPIWLGDCLCFPLEARWRQSTEKEFSGNLSRHLKVKHLKDFEVPNAYIAIVVSHIVWRHCAPVNFEDRVWMFDSSTRYKPTSPLYGLVMYRSIETIKSFTDYAYANKFMRQQGTFGAVLTFMKIL